jgi:phenylpyruvate tautomerase PptA (4-oxalocrotonate tautomerase family)
MPISYVDVPQGIDPDARKAMVTELYRALDEAYRIPDTRIFLREWPAQDVSQDGRIDSEPARPVVFVEVPPGIEDDAKRAMVRRISAAITDASRLSDVLVFIREYPLDMVSQDGLLQSENPVILEALHAAAGQVRAR